MNRPTRWKARLALAIVAALVIVPAAVAEASAPAGDEYVLELPGVRQSDSAVNAGPAGGRSGGGSGIQRGVVGETDEPADPLAALGDALGAIPTAIVAGLAILLALALLAVPARRPAPHGSR
jgi:hypothetical protein